MFRRTLNSAVAFEGIGVHSGCGCRISVAPGDEGIVFVTEDDVIPATFEAARDTVMCTRLFGANGSCVSTTEHLAAALYGIGITDATIKVENGEIPISDGSAREFVEAILAVGVAELSAKRPVLKVLKPVKVADGERRASLSPAEDSFSVNIECDFTAKGLKTEPLSFDFSKDDFITKIAPARTFGFLSDAEFLRKNNLAVGTSLENTVVFDDAGRPLNKGGLRFPDEPVRHKILDVAGDLSLTGCRIIGRFDAFCPGHRMNNLLIRALFEEKSNFEIQK
ncbi:MAG: UDP-3-O-acyl-N-acetylglucosamine deacetylase [Holosporaceae bacterium]|nr:UDP-3-O-acyl-N-acetylglucosamine deacetylase [Holosporaceae bacterium]